MIIKVCVVDDGSNEGFIFLIRAIKTPPNTTPESFSKDWNKARGNVLRSANDDGHDTDEIMNELEEEYFGYRFEAIIPNVAVFD